MVAILDAVDASLDLKGVDVAGNAIEKIRAYAGLPLLVEHESRAEIVLRGGQDEHIHGPNNSRRSRSLTSPHSENVARPAA